MLSVPGDKLLILITPEQDIACNIEIEMTTTYKKCFEKMKSFMYLFAIDYAFIIFVKA